jgi:hypothetical protein
LHPLQRVLSVSIFKWETHSLYRKMASTSCPSFLAYWCPPVSPAVTATDNVWTDTTPLDFSSMGGDDQISSFNS